MQSHNKENGKYVMIFNDKTCAQDWTQVCYIFHSVLKARNFADTSDLSETETVSEIVILFFFILFLGVICKGVSGGSPWTGP